MWLSLFILLLIGAITYFQTIHGLFSAVLFCAMALLSCAFAFSMHEYVAATVLAGWKPDFALALSLSVCFAVPLIIMRVIGDSLITRDCAIPRILDLGGSVVCGLATAFMICGILATSLQLLPFGGSILGFQNVTVDTEKGAGQSVEDIHEHGIWLSPDKVAVQFASSVSSGVFSGQENWKDIHPDYIQEIGWAQTVPLGVRIFMPPKSYSITGTGSEPFLYNKLTSRGSAAEYEAVTPKPGHRFWTVRIKPDASIKDSDNFVRFTLFQTMLVGTESNVPRQYHAVAVRDIDDPRYYVIDTRLGGRSSTKLFQAQLLRVNNDEIAVAFELPDGFQAKYLRYKLGTAIPITLRESEGNKEALPTRPDNANNKNANADRPSQPRRSRPGRTHGANVKDADFSTSLPFAVSDYSSPKGDLDEERGKLKEGSLLAKEDEQTGSGITDLLVPEGKACLRVSAKALKAGSILGQAKSFAVTSLKNYIVTDDKGTPYKICGQIAVARVSGEKWMEVQWYPEAMGSLGGLSKFTKIKTRNLKGPDYELYFLFCVDSGAKLVKFSTTGRSGGEDISDLELVAP